MIEQEREQLSILRRISMIVMTAMAREEPWPALVRDRRTRYE